MSQNPKSIFAAVAAYRHLPAAAANSLWAATVLAAADPSELDIRVGPNDPKLAEALASHPNRAVTDLLAATLADPQLIADLLEVGTPAFTEAVASNQYSPGSSAAHEADRLAATLDATEALPEDLALIVRGSWGVEHEDARIFRAAVFAHLAASHPEMVAKVGAKIATTSWAVLDPAAVPLVAAAVASGLVSCEDVVARTDTDAAIAVRLGEVEALYDLVPEAPLVKVAAKPDPITLAARAPHTGGRGSPEEAEMLRLMGFESAATYMSLSSGQGADDISALLASASAETWLDWACNMLTLRPEDGEVVGVFAGASEDLRKEITAEAHRRSDQVLDGNPELVLALENIWEGIEIPPAAVRLIVWHLSRHLGTSESAWDVAWSFMRTGGHASVSTIASVAAELAED